VYYFLVVLVDDSYTVLMDVA